MHNFCLQNCLNIPNIYTIRKKNEQVLVWNCKDFFLFKNFGILSMYIYYSQAESTNFALSILVNI